MEEDERCKCNMPENINNLNDSSKNPKSEIKCQKCQFKKALEKLQNFLKENFGDELSVTHKCHLLFR